MKSNTHDVDDSFNDLQNGGLNGQVIRIDHIKVEFVNSFTFKGGYGVLLHATIKSLEKNTLFVQPVKGAVYSFTMIDWLDRAMSEAEEKSFNNMKPTKVRFLWTIRLFFLIFTLGSQGGIQGVQTFRTTTKRPPRIYTNGAPWIIKTYTWEICGSRIGG